MTAMWNFARGTIQKDWMAPAIPPFEEHEMPTGEKGGGNGRTGPENRHMGEVYVEEVLKGTDRREAARIAGYSDNTGLRTIERVGGPVHSLLMRRLEDKGINEEFLAREYFNGIAQSQETGAKNKDLNAHAQYLKQLAFLMGYGKQNPAVAVQINNSTAPPGLDPTRAGELIRETTALLEAVKEAISDIQSGRVHAGSPGTEDSQAHLGMADPPATPPELGGGGGA